MAKPKMEFDKDYIYNLIMPSVPPANASEAPAAAADMPASSPEAVPAPSAEEDEDNPISDLRSRLFSRKNNGVAIPAVKREYAVVNIMELLVSDRLDSAFSKFHCCQCDKCRKDAVAAALNLLRPEYVVAEADEIDALRREHSTKEVSAALVKAILQVRAHPRH